MGVNLVRLGGRGAPTLHSPRMRVRMLTVGSRGDVEPVLALGSDLRSRGHDVVIATHERFRTAIEDRGVGFRILPGDPTAALETTDAHRLIRTGPSLVRVIRRFARLLLPWFDELTVAAPAAVDDAELILYSPLASVGWHLGEAMGVPSALLSLQPFQPTGEWSAVTMGGKDLGPPLNLLTHLVSQQLTWQPLRRKVQSWRQDDLGLGPLPFLGPYSVLDHERHPQLLGVSPAVVPPPPDWPPHVHVTGYWFLDPPSDWVPPDEVAAFLAEGPEPPLFVGFGSMTGVEDVAEQICRTALSLGYRIVTTAGATPNNSVLPVESIPHSWLFPRMAGVVHHGGAGTTAAVLRAGVPSLVIPMFADQPFWARRVTFLGAGTTIPFREVDHESVGMALGNLEAYRGRAGEVASIIAGEDGNRTAADIIERSWLTGFGS
ncbi:MAG: glycosyltransferase [Acidimicrobiia bacterium]|nr:glycosyltransferase [Acidimicrobiia bacterium]